MVQHTMCDGQMQEACHTKREMEIVGLLSICGFPHDCKTMLTVTCLHVLCTYVCVCVCELWLNRCCSRSLCEEAIIVNLSSLILSAHSITKTSIRHSDCPEGGSRSVIHTLYITDRNVGSGHNRNREKKCMELATYLLLMSTKPEKSETNRK
jgi:hypothetical protein